MTLFTSTFLGPAETVTVEGLNAQNEIKFDRSWKRNKSNLLKNGEAPASQPAPFSGPGSTIGNAHLFEEIESHRQQEILINKALLFDENPISLEGRIRESQLLF